MPVPSHRVDAGAWYDVRRGAPCADALARLAQRAVVLLGEQHDQAAHHRWQLDTITALYALRRDLTLGFEMFPRRVQPVLDRWTRGELDEAAFLAEADWPRVWGLDPELYLPLFRFARANRLSMRALNVDRETQRRVAAQSVNTPIDREGVGEAAPASSAYRKRLSAVFAMHPGGTDRARFERFVRAQQFWDRAMAEAIAHDANALTIGIMGSGHIEYGDGVPYQLAALGVSEVASTLPWPAGTHYCPCPSEGSPIADLLYGLAV